jgi:hypothetical protein
LKIVDLRVNFQPYDFPKISENPQKSNRSWTTNGRKSIPQRECDDVFVFAHQSRSSRLDNSHVSSAPLHLPVPGRPSLISDGHPRKKKQKRTTNSLTTMTGLGIERVMRRLTLHIPVDRTCRDGEKVRILRRDYNS